MNLIKRLFPPTHGFGWVPTALMWWFVLHHQWFLSFCCAAIATAHTYGTAYRDGYWGRR